MKRTVWDMKRRQSGLGGYASAGMAKATCQVVVFFFRFKVNKPAAPRIDFYKNDVAMEF